MTEEEIQRAKEVFDVAAERGEFRAAREYLNRICELSGEYAGIPMPIEGIELSIHPKYKFAPLFKAMEDPALDEEPDQDKRRFIIVNEWIRGEKRTLVLKDIDTKRSCFIQVNAGRRIDFMFNTMGVVDAWEIEPESKAVQKLARIIDHRQFRSYMMTGCFFERSKASRVGYIFRRLRPTIALSSTQDKVTPLCGLCMHPIGYYQHTHGGAMVPTDDVVAHLVMMRGDEHGFWKQCSQHQPDRVEAGI